MLEGGENSLVIIICPTADYRQVTTTTTTTATTYYHYYYNSYPNLPLQELSMSFSIKWDTTTTTSTSSSINNDVAVLAPGSSELKREAEKGRKDVGKLKADTMVSDW